ncbi:FAD-dependent monooxygenase [Methylibium sp.]|uniref:FAD-dependent monooxygenase n=1 Tax=Methylibium sp. TaxID=2067992 RepID=UPI0025CC7DAA|nr:FAD-dependent monooxygenase [Methylibium sp.]
MNRFDVCVLGRGAVGQALALALARLGLRVALGGAAPAGGPDVRTYALSARSVALLQQLRVWDALLAATPSVATRVTAMQIQGDAGGRLEFSAWQQRVTELAWIVDAAALERELATALRFSPHVTLTDTAEPAALTALCDGRDSPQRAALGVEMKRVDYGQRAIAARLDCDRPHQNTALQWFRAPDVLALLPFDLPPAASEQPANPAAAQPPARAPTSIPTPTSAPAGGKRADWPAAVHGQGYGLVWALPDARADELLALDDAAFEQALEHATQGTAGRLRLRGARAAWPLRLARAARWHGPGWVLLGDAAHVVHPLAGQGLNLGLADVQTLATVLAEGRKREPWRALGDERLLARYARERAAPTWAMSRVTDGLLQLFAHEAAPLEELRNRGLSLVNHLSPLKRWLTDRALRS